MRAKSRRFMPKDSEVPLSAMIDVVFLLLIYFIVAQRPVVEDTLITASAPDASGKASACSGGVLKIGICEIPGKGDDFYTLNGRPVHFQDLRPYMAGLDKETTLIALCDPNAKHSKLIRLLDLCEESGLSNVNIVNDAVTPFRAVR